MNMQISHSLLVDAMEFCVSIYHWIESKPNFSFKFFLYLILQKKFNVSVAIRSYNFYSYSYMSYAFDYRSYDWRNCLIVHKINLFNVSFYVYLVAKLFNKQIIQNKFTHLESIFSDNTTFPLLLCSYD